MVKITSKIKFIISVLSAITIGIAGVTVLLNYKTQQDSNVINIAGKQRMLTQMITKEVFINANKNSVDFEELNSAKTEFENSLNNLIKGNKQVSVYPPPTESINSSLLNIQKSWNSFVVDMNNYQTYKQQSINMKDGLVEKNQGLLIKSEEIVKMMVGLDLKGELIDISGKQRMLTQKMAFHLSSFVISGSGSDFRSFYEALDNYEKTLEQFLSSLVIKNYDTLYETILQTKELFGAFKNEAYLFIDNQMLIDKTLDTIDTKSIMILANMDEIVNSYTNESKSRREFLQIFQYVALSIAIIFIIYSFALVLNIQRLFEKFVSHSKDISNIASHNQPVMFAEDDPKDELSVATKHIDSFANNINQILYDANKALEESKLAIEKLANISQNETSIEDVKLKKAIDTSEDIAIQSLEDLANTVNMLKKLQQNFNNLHK